MTIHDLIFEHYPNYYPLIDRYFYRKKTKEACAQADVIICASEQTKRDLIEMYHVTENKIQVIYQMCDQNFFHKKVMSHEGMNLEQLGINKPYMLCVSSFNPRKNHERMIRAFANSPYVSDFQLICVGKGKRHLNRICKFIHSLKMEKKVLILSYLNNEQVVDLYHRAKGLVYLSEYEGFGIPILEAFAAEIPVLTSNISSMAEIAIGAGILVDPMSEEAIQDGYRLLLEDHEHNQKLIMKGSEKAKTIFSKEQFLQNTFNTYL